MKNENQITVNMENLTNEEREQLLKLVKKSNEATKKRWRAKNNKVYYFINYNNKIDTLKEINCNVDKALFEFGNYFKTKEEAEFELQKRLVYQELKDYALEHNEYELDWEDETQIKWYITYDYDAKPESFNYYCVRTLCDIGQIYFSSEKIAREAVKTVGEDRIKKYLFGVE